MPTGPFDFEHMDMEGPPLRWYVRPRQFRNARQAISEGVIVRELDSTSPAEIEEMDVDMRPFRGLS